MKSNAQGRSVRFPRCSLRTLCAVGAILAIIVIDQLIKYEIKTSFLLHESWHVTDWFQILFTENRGMAFGMQFVGTGLLALFRVLAIGFFVYALSHLIRRRAPLGLIICVSMIIAGAIGNLIDNMFYGLIFSESLSWGAPAQFVPWGEGYAGFMTGKVVDMFYFPLFTWPEWMPWIGGNIFFGAIFNFADASISCGAVALILFYYRYLSRNRIFDRKRR